MPGTPTLTEMLSRICRRRGREVWGGEVEENLPESEHRKMS